MEYNDEKLLSLEEYEIMAKEYSKSLKSGGFVFVKVDESACDILVSEIFDLLNKISSSLRVLGNFSELNKLLALTEKQCSTLQVLYPECSQEKPLLVRGNKNLIFLNFLSLESELILKLLSLCEQSPFSSQLNSLARERLYLTKEIFKQTKKS